MAPAKGCHTGVLNNLKVPISYKEKINIHPSNGTSSTPLSRRLYISTHKGTGNSKATQQKDAKLTIYEAFSTYKANGFALLMMNNTAKIEIRRVKIVKVVP